MTVMLLVPLATVVLTVGRVPAASDGDALATINTMAGMIWAISFFSIIKFPVVLPPMIGTDVTLIPRWAQILTKRM